MKIVNAFVIQLIHVKMEKIGISLVTANVMMNVQHHKSGMKTEVAIVFVLNVREQRAF